MKKKNIIIIAIALVLVIAAGLTVYFTTHGKDSKDTEELFRENVSAVGYENTIETAVPQTELYSLIKNHFESALPEGKTEKKAIIIGYDGCRADILKELVKENSAVAALTDEGAQLLLSYCGGVNYPEENIQKTSTAPGWCSILTGVWADKHGITANDITKSLDHKTLLTTLTEENVIDSASFITKWKGHFSRKNATYLLEKDYCESNNLNVAFTRCDNDEASFEFTLDEIEKEDCSDFIFVIYEPTDSAGHGSGFSYNNNKYKDAFRTADSYGFDTLAAIENRATYDTEDWLIIVTSDHGGISKDHGGASIQERMTFIVTNKDM